MRYETRNAGDHRLEGAISGEIDNGRMGGRVSSRGQVFSRMLDMNVVGERAVEEAGRGGLADYWRSLRSHMITLLLLAGVGVGLGCLVSLSQTRLYQAHTSLEIEELTPDPSEMKMTEKSSDAGESSALSDMPTQIKILQSSNLIARALDKLKRGGLETERTDHGASGFRALLPHSQAASGAKKSDDAVEKARENLTVRADGQTRILDVAFDSTDPKKAAAFANALASEFIEHNIEMRWNVSQRTAEWLTHELDEMRGKLEKSENALQEYATKSGLMFTSDRASVSDEKLRQLQAALASAEMERIAKQARYEGVVGSRAESNQDVIDDPMAREYQSKLADLMRQRADMGTLYTGDYGKVREVDAQIDSLRTSLDAERDALESHAKGEYEEAARRERLLALKYDTQGRSMNREAEKAIQYNILKREVDSNQQLYDAMLQRAKLVNAAAALRTTNVRILDTATVPIAPYKPRPVVNALLGCLSGVLLGALLIIARDRARHTLQERGDVNNYLNLPELGVIPRATRGWTQHGTSYDFTVAESFRGALTSILFSSRFGSRSHSQMLVLTSWSPGEGKSTTVSNLGIALAEIGRRVLIIDGDMRRPSIHKILKLENKVGLVELLTGREPMTLDISSPVIQKSDIPGLSVICSGRLPGNPSTLLYSQRAKDLLDLLRKEYDAILIDTPPMQTITDARLFGAMADAVVLVVRASSTSRDAALAAKQRFLDDGTCVLGAILNCWDARYSKKQYDYVYSSWTPS